MVSVSKVVRPTQLVTKKTVLLVVACCAISNIFPAIAGEGLENAEITGVQFQYNDTSWAARNLIDFNNRSRWLSRQQTNDINILLDSTGDPACFAGLSLQNYNVSNRNIKEFALLTTSNDALAADFGVAGWQPIPQNDNPTDLLNYMSWAQGARLVDFTYQHNANNWAAEHINDGDTFSQWLSNRARNELEFSFDADWNGANGDPINIDELEFLNYGNDDRSVRDFQVAYTTDGNVWRLLEVPGSEENDPDFIFTRESEGGSLDRVDNALSVTQWSGDHANDGDPNTQWLSAKGNNYLEFSFDPDFDLTSGKDGDTDDLFDINKIRIRNYGNNDDRSVRHFQVAYKTLTNSNWRKIEVPGSVPNEPDFNYALLFHGALMTEKSSELNSTSSGADNIHDGDQNTRWLARDLASRLAFQFDPEENNVHAEDSDLFTFEKFSLLNYGVDDRSINEFQVEVKTRGNTDWTPIRVPGAQIGDPDFNFALVNNGGILRSVDSEANNTNWAGRNINDGSHKTSWLSRKNNNVLEFVFDLDRDNATGGDGDLFSFNKFYIQNYGVDDRSIYEFQIEVQVKGSENWTAIPVPGAATGDPNFNFLLSNNGAELTLIDSEVNSTQWGADNFHDGDHTTRWLSNKMFNNLEFRFDVNHDDDFADTEDQFTIERFYLQNYGADDRSIKDFQVHVIMGDNPDWQRIQVPGSEAGQAGYNFTLEGHGGAVTFVDSELNSTSWAATNINDGDKGTRWLSNKQQNSIEFEFDTDYTNGTGDLINIDKIKLINYGNSNRSVATFQVEYLTSDTPGVWQVLTQADGATIFNAARNGNEQEWDVPDVANVSSVRFVSLTNHGDSRYTGVSEFIVEGDTVGPIYSFRAAMNGNGEYFELDPANYPTNVKALRFQSLTNYGDFSYAGLREFKVLGPSTLESTIFTANMNRDGQVFTLDNNDIPEDVTGVRLVTISNHGDPNYIAAREFKILGDAVDETTIFTAQMIAEKQLFELDSDDIVKDVTDVRLVTISNHGDRSYIGAKEFEILGPSITATHTFVGTMSAAEQTWVLDADDIPIDVTEVQLITINNYGDRRYIGLREFEVLGNGVTPSRTFTLPMTKGPHRITLDSADQISGAVGVKLITINNHGDPSYTGLTEFKLFGSPEIPNSATNATYKDYIFEAENVGQLQTFEFSEVNSKYLRLHTMTNFDDRSYTEAAELGIVEGNCAAGQWYLDELSWSGTDGEVLDNSKFGLHGKAFGFGNGEGANTAGSNSAIPGSPGTCRYGTFDGVDDYIEIPDSDGLDNTSALTISAWFNADTLQQTNGTNARGLLSKRPSFSNNVSYGMFFLRNAGGKLYIDIDRTNDRFTTNTVFTTERWYHIAVVFDGSLPADERVAVYVDGQLDGRFRESSTSIPNTDSNFYIGNLYTGTSELKVFDGAIDEVNVLPFAYSQAQVNKLMNQTRPCDAQVDHIRITHSGSGVSCADHSVNLTACANADCSAIYTGSDISFTLQKNSNGTISDLGTYVIDGSTGQRNDVTYTETELGSYELTGTSAEAPLVKCLNSSSNAEDCSYNVASSGFVVTQGDYGTTQACGTNSFTIQAVQSSNDPSSGACVPAFASGDYPLTFSYSYHNPTSAEVVNQATATIEGTNHNAGQTGSAQNVTFDANAQAVIDVGYAEAGLISVTVNDANGNLTSANAVVGFVPSAISASWVDGDPNNTAGISEQVVIAGQCADGTVLQNYVPSGNYQVSALRLAPTDAEITAANSSVTPNNLEQLTIANTTTVNPNGSSEQVNVTGSASPQILNVDYDEAATLQLNFEDNNYLGQKIPSAGGLTGSFGISHYTATNNTPALTDSCGAFSYIGQDVLWATNPEVTLTAKNAIDGVTEFADIDGYWQHSTVSMETEFLGNTYTENTSNANNSVMTENSLTTAQETNLLGVDGQRSYQVSGQRIRYIKTSTPDVPFDANLDLEIPAAAFVDANGIGIKTNASDPTYLPVEFLGITGSELRYGRLKAESTYGSELENLPWRAQLEVFSGGGEWQYNADDNCSVLTQDAVTIDGINEFDVNNNPPRYTLEIGGKNSGAETSLFGFDGISQVDAIAGIFTLPFVAPGDQNIGSLDIEVDLTSQAPYLRWDWNDDADGTFVDADGDGIDDSLDLNLPVTTITFGRFRGNDRIIYKRER